MLITVTIASANKSAQKSLNPTDLKNNLKAPSTPSFTSSNMFIKSSK